MWISFGLSCLEFFQIFEPLGFFFLQTCKVLSLFLWIFSTPSSACSPLGTFTMHISVNIFLRSSIFFRGSVPFSLFLPSLLFRLYNFHWPVFKFMESSSSSHLLLRPLVDFSFVFVLLGYGIQLFFFFIFSFYYFLDAIWHCSYTPLLFFRRGFLLFFQGIFNSWLEIFVYQV